MNDFEAYKKRLGNIRVRPNQFQMMVEAMEKNPLMMLSVNSGSYKLSDRNKDWIELSQKLNGAGGAKKSVKSWQKTWSDKKLEVKRKYKLSLNERLKPVEERDPNLRLKKVEQRIADLIKLGSTDLSIKKKKEPIPTELVVLKVEDCPSSSTSENFHPVAPCPRNNPNFIQGPALTDFEGVLLADTPTHLPNIQSPDRPEPPTSQFVISEVRSSEDINTQNLVEGQTAMVTALNRFAMALEKQNQLQEKALEIKKQKADAFTMILSLLKDKL